MYTHLVHPWGPLVSPDCRVLILGSFPSVKSRAEGFFYGHPRNRFWPMIAAVCGEERPWSIDEKRELVLRHGIALWDTIGECDIHASEDASVRNAVPVDIGRVLSVARIEQVLCNGALSGRLYRRHLLPVTGMDCLVMPSTSPANAAVPLEQLIAVWGDALRGHMRTP